MVSGDTELTLNARFHHTALISARREDVAQALILTAASEGEFSDLTMTAQPGGHRFSLSVPDLDKGEHISAGIALVPLGSKTLMTVRGRVELHRVPGWMEGQNTDRITAHLLGGVVNGMLKLGGHVEIKSLVNGIRRQLADGTASHSL